MSPGPRQRVGGARHSRLTLLTEEATIATMMVLDRRYPMDDEDALARGKALTEYWSRKHGVRITWSGPTATIAGRVMGVKFEGTVRVEKGIIHAEMSAGFLAEKLGARAYVERKLDDYFDPTHPLSELLGRIPR